MTVGKEAKYGEYIVLADGFVKRRGTFKECKSGAMILCGRMMRSKNLL